MAILSSPLLLRSHALTLVTISYYLLTSPTTILNSGPVWILGESMSVRPASFTPETAAQPPHASKLPDALRPQAPPVPQAQAELFALLALLICVYAVLQMLFAGDLTLPFADDGASRAQSSARVAEETHTLLAAQSRWMTLAGVRVLGSAGLVFWIYVFHGGATAASARGASGFALLANSAVFTAGFADMLFWGYMWTVLKDEARQVAEMLARRRAQEEEDDE